MSRSFCLFILDTNLYAQLFTGCSILSKTMCPNFKNLTSFDSGPLVKLSLLHIHPNQSHCFIEHIFPDRLFPLFLVLKEWFNSFWNASYFKAIIRLFICIVHDLGKYVAVWACSELPYSAVLGHSTAALGAFLGNTGLFPASLQLGFQFPVAKVWCRESPREYRSQKINVLQEATICGKIVPKGLQQSVWWIFILIFFLYGTLLIKNKWRGSFIYLSIFQKRKKHNVIFRASSFDRVLFIRQWTK